MTKKYLNTKEKKRSAVITLIIMLLFIILAFFPVFTYETPTPLEKEIVNLDLMGYSVNNESGGGATASTTKSASATQAQTNEAKDPTTSNQPANKVETQTQESTSEVNKTTTTTSTNKEQNAAANNPFAGNGDSGDNNDGSNGNPGDNGRGGRSGDGDGEGSDGFNGSGQGGGLEGRKLLSKPDLDSDCSAKGKVVLIITVSGTGEVLQARIDPAKSNTSNQCLVNKAIQEAKQLKWEKSGQPSVTGSITFIF